jgi:predicted enzyme related to lactoylglutathione lyase
VTPEGADGGTAMTESSAASRPRWGIAPFFVVDDVVSTANYYRDTLGFKYERFWGEPPSFCMVRRNGVVIMLSQLAHGVMRPNRLVDPEGGAWDAYIWIDDADALHEEFTSKRARIVRDVCDQPYGCRDFEVEDCNGYRLCFGQDIEGE